MNIPQTVATGVCLAGIALAQTAVPGGMRDCGGLHITGPSSSLGKPDPLLAPEPRAIIPTPEVGSELCSGYTYAGWKTTMKLRLGEGAAEYLDIVEQAVDLWNETLMGFNQQPVIEIVRSPSPVNLGLSADFWSDPSAESDRNVRDGQSVIYFKPSEPRSELGGFAQFRWDNARRMVESDVYIDTHDEVNHGRDLAKTTLALQTDEEHGVYVYVNSTYLTVLHELGHALGLNHIPVSGNIMSYSFMPRMREIWRAPMVPIFFLFEQAGSIANPLLNRIGDVPPYVIVDDSFVLDMLPLYTHAVDLRQQDRMALMCIYDFEDWNH